MAEIEILSEKTVNQIAAGEVIKRPSSVAKELIENSLDAGADEIEVKVKEGGKELIRVKDDGVGMERDEAKLAFKKHATSKINRIEDLDDLRSLGFRGEALPSIAAVSKVRVLTKTADEVEGTELVIEGGDIKKFTEAGCPVGTIIEVRELFYNTPARKKHLKKKNTELAHVSDVVTRNALSREKVQFKLEHEDRELLFVPSSDSLLENIKSIYGKDVAKQMLKVDFSDDYIDVRGFVSKPDVTRSRRKHMFSYVNSRYVRNDLVLDGILDGYQNLLLKKRYPIAVIKIQIDGSEIDVNVHPTKTKIRFYEEKKGKERVAEAVKSALFSHDLIPSLDDKDIEPMKQETEDQRRKLKTVKSGIKESGKDFSTQQQRLKLESNDEIKKTSLGEMRVVGIVNDLYIIAETPEGMAMIDQHAAHERVNYERFERKYDDNIDSQRLVSPTNLDLKPREVAIIRANEDLLKKLGFDIEHFGRTTFRVLGVPVVLGEVQEKELLHSVLDELMESKGSSLEERKEEMIKYMACHDSVRAGDMLSVSSAKDIIEKLGETENPYTCPHGRPTIVKFSEKKIKKWFKRT